MYPDSLFKHGNAKPFGRENLIIHLLLIHLLIIHKKTRYLSGGVYYKNLYIGSHLVNEALNLRREGMWLPQFRVYLISSLSDIFLGLQEYPMSKIVSSLI